VKVESGKKTINEDVQVLNIDGQSTQNPQAIASVFKEYFLSLIEKIYVNNNNTTIQYIICHMLLIIHFLI
jgi:hypothetical protein